jgi:uroporphyrinogen-III synthase
MEKSKAVIITRAAEDGAVFIKKLEQAGFGVRHFPLIRIIKLALDADERALLSTISSYDYCVFTSAHAVTFFLEALNDLGIGKNMLENMTIAALGKETSQALKQAGLAVSFEPAEFTSKALAAGLKNISGKKILIPRSAIASPVLGQSLKDAGAKTFSLDLYTTKPIVELDPAFEDLLEREAVECITFTSSSAVTAFVGCFKDAILFQKARTLPLVCIGPRTFETAEQFGFLSIRMANPFTIDGIIETIKKHHT